jgi:hypothetical protein
MTDNLTFLVVINTLIDAQVTTIARVVIGFVGPLSSGSQRDHSTREFTINCYAR